MSNKDEANGEEEEEVYDVQNLEIETIIGFDGKIINGFKIHPDKKHVVYPLGNKITILNWYSKQQYFLEGHTNIVSTIALSNTGKYIASGQINHIGFKANVIIWDFCKRVQIGNYEIHKVRVESVCFSINDQFLMSIGGRDDGNLVIYDMNQKEPLCGTLASSTTGGEAYALCNTNKKSHYFMSGGENNLRVWEINESSRSLSFVNVNVSKIRRTILCIRIDEHDNYAYCGTSTGDIMKIRLNFDNNNKISTTKPPIMCGLFGIKPVIKKKSSHEKVILYSMGVRSLYLLNDNGIIVGTGDGLVDLVYEIDDSNSPIVLDKGMKLPSHPKLKSLRRTKVRDMVTSLQMLDENTILVCTNESEIYSINLQNFNDIKLLITCHTSIIYTLNFPHNFSKVFATTSKNDVRIWSLCTKQELLRIRVANFACSSVCFSYDGKSIITGWNDGVIRAFTPLTGRLMYAILNAHNKGTSALTITRCGKRLISGGCEGHVRVWNISPQKQELFKVLKEHKGPITDIDINSQDTEAVSASSDGTCIIWDIVRYCRKQILIRNTLFMCCRFFPLNGVQILTGGSDRKIAYWEVFDGSMIRELEGSISEAINTLDISPDGKMFVTGGNDQILKLWKYDEGITTHIGLGHAGVITGAKFSPDGKHIISTSSDGCIFIWKCPSIINNEKITREKINKSFGENIDKLESARSVKSEPIQCHHEGSQISEPLSLPNNLKNRLKLNENLKPNEILLCSQCNGKVCQCKLNSKSSRSEKRNLYCVPGVVTTLNSRKERAMPICENISPKNLSISKKV